MLTPIHSTRFGARSDGFSTCGRAYCSLPRGWPRSDAVFMPSLFGFRKYLETFDVVHEYHVRPMDGCPAKRAATGAVDASMARTQGHLSGQQQRFGLRPEDL